MSLWIKYVNEQRFPGQSLQNATSAAHVLIRKDQRVPDTFSDCKYNFYGSINFFSAKTNDL